MSVGTFGFLYVGAFAAKWIPQGGAKMLIVHIASQVLGLVILTVGLIVGCQRFTTPYWHVEYSHGSLGFAVMALAYFQGTGFLRPKKADGKPHREQTWARRVFELGHGGIGKLVLALAILNCFTGLIIMHSFTTGDTVAFWAGLCVTMIIVLPVIDWAYHKLRQGDLPKKRAQPEMTDLPRHACSSPLSDGLPSLSRIDSNETKSVSGEVQGVNGEIADGIKKTKSFLVFKMV